MKVFADLQSRGCQDILIAVTDGLKGMREALEALYPATTFQTCLVHLLRHSLDFANWKERKPLAAALRPIYTAASADVAAAALDAIADGPWGRRFPTVVASWRRAWPHVIPSSPSCPRSAGARYDECAGERARPPAQDPQDSRALPDRRGGDEANLDRLAPHHGDLGEAQSDSRFSCVHPPCLRFLRSSVVILSPCTPSHPFLLDDSNSCFIQLFESSS